MEDETRQDEENLRPGKTEYQQAGEERQRPRREDDTEEQGELDRGSHSRIEEVPQAPLEGPDRASINYSDSPGEIASNMGLNQTFDMPGEDAEGDDGAVRRIPEDRDSERESERETPEDAD